MDVLLHDNYRDFISVRFIGENTRLLYEFMHYCNDHEIPGFLLLLDFEKGFVEILGRYIPIKLLNHTSNISVNLSE